MPGLVPRAALLLAHFMIRTTLWEKYRVVSNLTKARLAKNGQCRDAVLAVEQNKVLVITECTCWPERQQMDDMSPGDGARIKSKQGKETDRWTGWVMREGLCDKGTSVILVAMWGNIKDVHL